LVGEHYYKRLTKFFSIFATIENELR